MRWINRVGLEIIKRNEGLRLTAYQDTGGIWTIGWGHTPAYPGQSISLAQADALLASDIAWAEDAVYGATKEAPTNDNHFSAMVSFTFNVGAGQFATAHERGTGFRGSSVLRKHLAGDYAGAANSFLLWNKDNGRALKGLTRRRGEERELYLNPVDPMPSAPPPMVDLDIEGRVRELQHALLAAGYYHGRVDADPGPLTMAALRAWRATR